MGLLNETCWNFIPVSLFADNIYIAALKIDRLSLQLGVNGGGWRVGGVGGVARLVIVLARSFQSPPDLALRSVLEIHGHGPVRKAFHQFTSGGGRRGNGL